MKLSLTKDKCRTYYSDFDITLADLEKRNCTGEQLICGTNLLDLAKKGVRCYKKALAFCLHKWDSEKMIPRHSGDSVDDVINYVRRNMYQILVKKEEKNSDLDSDLETEDVINNQTKETIETEHANDDTCFRLSDDDGNMPDNYIFPSFFVFIAWGPFVPPDERLMYLIIVIRKLIIMMTTIYLFMLEIKMMMKVKMTQMKKRK